MKRRMAGSTWLVEETSAAGLFDVRGDGRIMARDLELQDAIHFVARRDPKATEVDCIEADGYRSPLRIRSLRVRKM